MDSTVLAVLVGAVVAGAGGAFVPRLIAAIPPIEPEPDEPKDPDAPDEPDEPATVEEEPEPFPEIAASPGLAWRSALVSLLAGAVVGYAVGWTWALVVLVPCVPVAVALSVVDWRTRLLPTAVIRPAALGILGLVVVGAVVTQDLHAVERSLLAGVLAFVFFFVVFWIYPRGLGFGDVRLSGVMGLALGWVGWGTFVVGLYAGFLLGGVLGGILSALRVVDRKGYPFGPFILGGALVGLLWGPDLWGSLVNG
jgi:leader peptidase (prepilin peptidase)/N-methyltransferase